MLRIRQILATASVLVGLAVAVTGCGQKGALFIPTEPAAAQRATLPQSLRTGTPPAGAAIAPSAASSSPKPAAP